MRDSGAGLQGDAAAGTLAPAQDRYVPGVGPPPGRRPEVARPEAGEVVRTYTWQEFGREHVTAFEKTHFETDEAFQSGSSLKYREYQDRLRCVTLRKQGYAKVDIAKILGRPEKFVAKWHQKEEKELPKPDGLHAYLTGSMGDTTIEAGKADDAVTDVVARWRDVEVFRKFHADPAIYEEVTSRATWDTTAARGREFTTGAQYVKYNKEGKMRLQSNVVSRYQQGLSPALDKALQKLFAMYGIEGRTAGIGLNWYRDGTADAPAHRHDCWTALFSFGSERILTIDKKPLLLLDGDLVIFGTQTHGVPLMPEVSDGRISVPVFFYPNHLQMRKQWKTLTDDTILKSRELISMEKDKRLATDVDTGLWSEHAFELQQVCELGFPEDKAKAALIAQGFDVTDAAQMLLAQACPQCCVAASESCEEVLAAGPVDSEEVDTAMGMAEDDEAATLALVRELQMQELDEQRQHQDLLKTTFAEYDKMLDKEEAKNWNGFGDLMAMRNAREALTLDGMDKVTVFSLGHGDLDEKNFWAMIVHAQIRCIYDFRGSDWRGEVWAPATFLSVRSLRTSCKARGVRYKSIPLGGEGSNGILAHLKSEQAQHGLIELVWQAKNFGASGFLGRDEDWRKDPRLAIAEELSVAGHRVRHVTATGTSEAHISLQGRYPDWMLQEEAASKKRALARKEGTLKPVEKSRHSGYSSEAIASSLTRPVEVIDARAELRAATNQVELNRAQRKLGRFQRQAAAKGDLATRVVTDVPVWIKEEARQQEEFIRRKEEERQAKKSASTGASGDGAGLPLKQDASKMQENEDREGVEPARGKGGKKGKGSQHVEDWKPRTWSVAQTKGGYRGPAGQRGDDERVPQLAGLAAEPSVPTAVSQSRVLPAPEGVPAHAAAMVEPLAAMGFDADQIAAAVRHCTTVEEAVEWLSTRGDTGPPPVATRGGAEPGVAGALLELGFTRQQAQAAAARCSDVAGAVDWLVSSGEVGS